MPKDANTVLERIDMIRRHNRIQLHDRARIRSIMNGGVDGILAVMAWDMGKGASMRNESRARVANAYGTDLPTVNLMASGLDRLAQRVGVAPTLKAPYADDESTRRRWEQRTEIVRGWDYEQEIELQWPQVGRWLPGYSQVFWTIGHHNGRNGQPYPVARLRDSYDVYPGWLGPDQQPDEVVVCRVVPLMALRQAYPELDWASAASRLEARRKNGTAILGAPKEAVDLRTLRWEGWQSGVEVVEYYDSDGCSYVVPELALPLHHVPNPLDSGPAFVFGNKISFDAPISQYHHVIGMMSMMAKYNILGLIAAEDSVFRETNIAGELESNTYQRGRFAVNLFAPGTQISKPTGDQANQLWAQIDRLERQFRIGAAYDVTQDGRSPVSYATGEAVRELGTAAGENIREYQTSLKHCAQRIDSKRLEYAEKMWPRRKLTIYDMNKDNATYTPARQIKGDHRTRRVYGAMAGWDDQAKAVVGLQYLQAGVFDIETIQENIKDLESAEVVRNRNRARAAEQTLMSRLAARGEQDPTADAALVEIMANPEKQTEILAKYFGPNDDQLSEDEQAQLVAQQQLQAGAAGMGAPEPITPESVTSVLSRLEAGEAGGGVQTVGQLQ